MHADVEQESAGFMPLPDLLCTFARVEQGDNLFEAGIQVDQLGSVENGQPGQESALFEALNVGLC